MKTVPVHLNLLSIVSPVLVYPSFSPDATEFVLQTDASVVGLGAVLDLNGHPIAYASQSLTSSECIYIVIQRKGLATVFALKQFHHYLLGCTFQLHMYVLIMLHCNGYQLKKWKAHCANGH